MIRILNIVTQMNRAGLENRIMDIYRNIDRSKIQFDFYTNREEKGIYDDEIISLGGKVYYSKGSNIFNLKNKEREFYKFLLEHQEYRLIHSHMNELSTIYCRAAKKAGVPIRIAHSRGANKGVNLKKYFKELIKLNLKKYATHLFAVSKVAGEHLFGKKAVYNKEVQIWPNSIECKKYEYDENIRKKVRELEKLKNNFVFINVANLIKGKNQIFLIEIFEEIQKLKKDSMLLIAGEGPERKKLENKIKKKKLEDKIKLLGNREDVNEILQGTDCFITTSLYEGFPGAVLEAQAAGLPCFISNTITSEVCLLNTTFQFSLKESPKYLAIHILEKLELINERKNTYEVLKKKGYDIKTLAKKYENFYLKEVKKYD